MGRGLAAVLVALLLPLAGCGGDSTDAYCSKLTADRTKIADLIGSDSPSALLDGLPTFQRLADKAPEDIADQWNTYVDALQGLHDALKAAGVKASDFNDGKPPAGLSATDQQAIAEAATQLGADEVVQASSDIEQEARDVCKVNLGL
ncbi:MAG: hypothetical protein JWQ15_699 [Marmoricola sp.]|nr:hypothetical protein [Marmoricola sp.]